MLRLALPLALSCLFACAHGKGLSREEAQARFSKLTTDYFDEAFAFEPTTGTVAGFHQYDPKLEDFSAARVATHVQKLQEMLDRAVALWTERVALPYDDLIDLEALGSVPAERAGPLARYAATIQGQRGDYNGKVLSIRQDDLRTLAVIYDMPPAALADELITWGVLDPDARRAVEATMHPEI